MCSVTMCSVVGFRLLMVFPGAERPAPRGVRAVDLGWDLGADGRVAEHQTRGFTELCAAQGCPVWARLAVTVSSSNALVVGGATR